VKHALPAFQDFDFIFSERLARPLRLKHAKLIEPFLIGKASIVLVLGKKRAARSKGLEHRPSGGCAEQGGWFRPAGEIGFLQPNLYLGIQETAGSLQDQITAAFKRSPFINASPAGLSACLEAHVFRGKFFFIFRRFTNVRMLPNPQRSKWTSSISCFIR